MKRLAAHAVALLAAAAMLEYSSAHAQARGPSVQEVQENGRYIAPDNGARPPVRLVDGWREVLIGEPAPDVELSALGPAGVLNEADRLEQLAALEHWFRRLPGRFRIDGVISAPGISWVQVVSGGNAMQWQSIPTQFEEKVSGIAECAAVGESVGVQCVLNATWPTMPGVGATVPPDMAMFTTTPSQEQQLNTMRPAMLVMGLNLDSPGVRALLVTDDSIAHTWAGKLMDGTLTADRLTECVENVPGLRSDSRCLQPLQVIAPSDSGIVTIVLKRGIKHEPSLPPPRPAPSGLRALTITLTMYPDPEAQPEKPMQTKKVR